MGRYYFEDFLSGFDSRGIRACSCGREHLIATRTVLAEPGALERSGELLVERYGSRTALWVLSDENTERAAGARWKRGGPAARVSSRVLRGSPRPVPTEELVRQLVSEVKADSPDLLVAVGSGVISDLVKKVSLDTGIPNWCIATAASVDAYSSATSAIRVDGYHKPLPAAVSEVIVCDIDVIGEAPREMFLAGLGDLLAKFIAFLDWNLSRIMTGEHYCAFASGAALGSARAALAAAGRLGEEPREAARTLTDAVLTSGFAMQATGASRSAASAEHTMAHFWEMAHAVGCARYDLHGILVGAACALVLRAYRALYAAATRVEPDAPRRLAGYDGEQAWEAALEPGLAPFIGKVREETAHRRFDRAVLAERLEAFRRSRQEILALAAPALDELASAVEALRRLGYPFSPAELGISADLFLLPGRNIRLLRRRYSGFDLAYELDLGGLLNDEMERCVREG